MDSIDNFELSPNKIYCVYADGVSYTGRYLKLVRIAEVVYLALKIMDEGWGGGKNVYVQTKCITQILEFESMDEYREHYQSWEEEEKERKFKTGGDY